MNWEAYIWSREGMRALPLLLPHAASAAAVYMAVVVVAVGVVASYSARKATVGNADRNEIRTSLRLMLRAEHLSSCPHTAIAGTLL